MAASTKPRGDESTDWEWMASGKQNAPKYKWRPPQNHAETMPGGKSIEDWKRVEITHTPLKKKKKLKLYEGTSSIIHEENTNCAMEWSEIRRWETQGVFTRPSTETNWPFYVLGGRGRHCQVITCLFFPRYKTRNRLHERNIIPKQHKKGKHWKREKKKTKILRATFEENVWMDGWETARTSCYTRWPINEKKK